MIRDNKLSYTSVDQPWHVFEIPNTFFSSLVTSILVTAISYQVTSILFSVVLGLKKRDETKLKNFGIVLLARYLSSPLALMNSILRMDWLTRLYYYGDIPSDTRISRDPARVKVRTVISLIFLVVATPIFDTLLVALSLSRSSGVTFEEAGFRGVQLGVNEQLNVVETIPYLSLCRSAMFEERPGDVLRAVFQLCDTPILEKEENSSTSGFEISLESQVHVFVRVKFQGYAVLGAKWTQLSGVGTEKNFRALITETSVAPLVELALDQFERYCGERSTFQGIRALDKGERDGNNVLVASVGVVCNNTIIPKPNRRVYAAEITELIRAKLTFVESERTLVRDITDVGSEFVEETKGVLLQRTKRNSSMFTLITLCATLVLVRTVLSALLSNDVEAGLERIFLNRVRLKAGHTTVWNGVERIHFRKKYQDGAFCQLGMEREELTEVECFQGGVVGEVNEDTVAF